jgi:hypothetical protein
VANNYKSKMSEWFSQNKTIWDEDEGGGEGKCKGTAAAPSQETLRRLESAKEMSGASILRPPMESGRARSGSIKSSYSQLSQQATFDQAAGSGGFVRKVGI